MPKALPAPDHIKFMGGVNLSDQLIGYHPILRQTKRYWKTLFYHLVEIAATNAFILYKWQCVAEGRKPPTESHFWDSLVLDTTDRHGTETFIPDSFFTMRHCRMAVRSRSRRRCPICNGLASRQCQDCTFTPALWQKYQFFVNGIIIICLFGLIQLIC